ncbi:hypothetical protein GCM10009760_30940 [Kitasatospora kazusensis]|uniref:Excreted virulence factor EspC (Type VII ESX diderm) n=1 Tax=Kitasatospora kazusensis TaxID=407974 RepID=A0ABP5LA84_9ACTN
MSTGSRSSGGSGYRVEVDSLRAFAAQVRGLLSEFQASADGTRTRGVSGVGQTAFGTFAEATTLHDKYETMRDGLCDVLDALHAAIDAAQHRADLTASNYEEQESDTSRRFRVAADGWSVDDPVPGNPAPTRTAYRGLPTRPAGPPAAPTAPAGSAPAGGGSPQPTW